MAEPQGLSALARVLKKRSFEEFAPKDSPLNRESFKQSVPKGFTRGTLGSQGSSPGVETRNPDAQADEEREFLQSSRFEQIMDEMTRI